MVALVLATVLATSTTARAACSVIPAATRIYRSAVGGIDRRLAGPHDRVTVVNGCAQDPTFDSDPTKNEVTLLFGSSAPVPVTIAIPKDCVANACTKLEFEMPDTDPASGSSFAGPATIVVRPKGQPTVTLAQIYALQEPLDPRYGCDQTAPDETFGTFTVLPRANIVRDLVAGGADLRMAPDGRSNILIPLKHDVPAGAPPGATWAQVERGLGIFCAKKPWLNLLCSLGTHPVDEELASATGPNLLRAFTPDGSRIAPIFMRDDQGRLFGLADAAASVLRIENDGRFDLGYLRQSGTAPIVVSDTTKREAGHCEVARLQGARTTDALIATTSAAGELWVRSKAKAGKKCSPHGTQASAIDTDLGGGRMEPVVDADGESVALVDKTTRKVRTFDADAKETTPNPSKVADGVGLAVNRFPIAVQDGRVFFRTPMVDADVLDVGNGTFATVVPQARTVEISGHRAALIDTAGRLLAYDASSAVTPTVLLTSGAKAAAVTDGILGAIDGGGKLEVWPWTSATPGGVLASSHDADALAATRGCRIDPPNACASRLVFTSPPAAGAELSLASIDAGGGLVIPPPPTCRDSTTSPAQNCTALDFVAGERLVAFRDASTAIMYVGAFRDPSVTGGLDFVVKTTGTTALGSASRWHDLGWRTPYVVTSDDVLFLTEEGGQERLVVYHYRSDTLRIVATVAPSNGPQAALLAGVLDGELRILGGGLAGGDEDGDGVLDAVDVCPQAWNQRQIDDDRDGLGEKAGSDEGCDPTLCSDLRPPSSLRVRTSLGDPAGAAKRALAYLEVRVDGARRCMAAERDDPAADLDALCLGSFAGDAETPRLRGPTKEEVRAERALLAELAGSHAKSRETSTHLARQVIRAYGEAANAIARVTATSPKSTAEALLGRARSMHECATSRITKHTADLEACFGALVAGIPPQPWATAPADCVTWRRSVLAATTLLGEPAISSTP